MQEFLVVDKVMVRIHPKRFPPETVKNFHARYIGSYRILREIGSNTYELDIPQTLGINPIFNNKELTRHLVTVDFAATIPNPSSFATTNARYFPSLPPPLPLWMH